METATLAFEIGVEEIPAFDLKGATAQLASLAPSLLDQAAIPHGEVEIFDSPRRLIVIARDIPQATEAKSEVFKGPSAKIAFDDSGAPTKAAQGFARGKGLDASDLVVEDGYVYARVETPSVQVASLLPQVLDGIIHGISWPKSQRWGTQSEWFSRPVRWLVALFGSDIIPYQYAGLSTSNKTCGHRFLAPGFHGVACADDLIDVVRQAKVVPSARERESLIRAGVAAVEQRTGLVAQLPAKTLTEVTNLAEYPTVLEGIFDEEFLAVPEEIIVDAMLMHQRYFPLYDAKGKLTNHFLVVSNGDPDCAATIIDGNERVVRARLFDAKFFYDEDLKHPLESYVEKLSEVVFQEKLGTMLAKTNRLVRLAKHLVADAGLAKAEAENAVRAAYLCKADLVTEAVVEFTSVQGIMGCYYAAASGEDEQVAQAIADHYRPRFSGDEPPAEAPSQVVAVADKLDTICGLFAVGQGPTGSSDPFALRRSALGIVSILLDEAHGSPLRISLVSAIDAALAIYQEDGLEFDIAEVRQQVIDFFITRTKVMLRDAGNSSDAVEAVLAVGVQEPTECVKRVQALEKARGQERETFDNLAIAFARANNLRDAKAGVEVDTSTLNEVEQALLEAIDQAEAGVSQALSANDYAAALADLARLRVPIDSFFEGVLVMDDDPAIRVNRMKLLNRFVGVFARVADFAVLNK